VCIAGPDPQGTGRFSGLDQVADERLSGSKLVLIEQQVDEFYGDTIAGYDEARFVNALNRLTVGINRAGCVSLSACDIAAQFHRFDRGLIRLSCDIEQDAHGRRRENQARAARTDKRQRNPLGRQDHGDKLNLGLGMVLQPSSRLLITLTPRYDRTSSAAQYVTSSDALAYEPTFGTRYIFADLERRDLSMVTRVNLTFTPKLSLEVYAQPLITSGDYVTYKQLAESQTFDFEIFAEGSVSGAGCDGGRTCLDSDGTRYVDFDADGTSDLTFDDRDFNLRSLNSTAVLRWEYRPGSTFFLVWQHRQVERAAVGDFDFSRDLNALFGAPADDVLILKANIWLSL